MSQFNHVDNCVNVLDYLSIDVINHFQDIRNNEVILSNNEIYFDAAGSALPMKSALINAHNELLSGAISYNPHSFSHNDDLINNIRIKILEFLTINNDNEYDIIFTSNATSSIKLLGESFPWNDQSIFIHPINSHTSILGLREYCKHSVCLSNDLSIDLLNNTQSNDSVDKNERFYSLFACPGECNFTGDLIELKKVSQQINNFNNQSYNQSNNQMLWLLDASKLVSTSPLDLSMIETHERPHFICLSFYKIFGYPTGLGALIVRKDIAHILTKRYYGGGTVQAISAIDNFVIKRKLNGSIGSLGKVFEDGTINYQGISAVRHGINAFNAIGGMKMINQFTTGLRNYLQARLISLKHTTGTPMLTIYGSDQRGPVITFNVFWSDGKPVGHSLVLQLASERRIRLRGGCMCNPGGCQKYLQLSTDDIKNNYSIGRVCGDDMSFDIIDGRCTGAIRASLGYHSTVSDCDALINLLVEQFLDKKISAPSSISFYQVNDLTIRDEIKSPLVLESLYIYPIKSCKGYQITKKWRVTSFGLYLDRYWAIASSSTGRILTMKQYPKLSQVSIDIIDDRIQIKLIISHPSSLDNLELIVGAGSSEIIEVKLCGRKQEAITMGLNIADDWFTKLLDMKCQLVQTNLTDKSFVNDAELLLLSKESVMALNHGFTSTSKDSISIENFRPNLVVSGGINRPHQEDYWLNLSIPAILNDSSSNSVTTIDLIYEVTAPCSRCFMVNIDSRTGVADGRVFDTISTYRKDRTTGRVNFGQFLSMNKKIKQMLIDSNHLNIFISLGCSVSIQESNNNHVHESK